MRSPRVRATVSLTRTCDNECAFCAQRGESALGRDPTLDEVRDALSTARSGHDEVTFVGGEPGGAATLELAVASASELGFDRIGVQSHGARLAEPAFVRALVDAGLTDVALSLHGPTAPAHEHHTGREGSYEEVLAAARAASASEIPTVVTTVLTRSSYRVLASLGPLLRDLRVAAWQVRVLAIAGSAGESFDRMVPRLAMAIPFALHALHAAGRAGIEASLAGAPVCLLGPLATLAARAPSGSYGPPCDACEARPSCPGVDAAYLERFGAGELRPRALPEEDGARATDHLFVGPGELAPPLPRPPFSPGRRSLDVVD